jgi:hypothetical protein
MAMTTHDKWYQNIDGTEKPLVQGNVGKKVGLALK